jgi:hypothetical protein
MPSFFDYELNVNFQPLRRNKHHSFYPLALIYPVSSRDFYDIYLVY